MPKDTYVPSLLQLFRHHGYDGATLAKISQATGLGKASLYHHFPGGKDEMVETLLDRLSQGLDQIIARSLHQPGAALHRLQQMCAAISQVYGDGEQPCLLATLLLGSARDVFHEPVKALLVTWIEAIAAVLVEAGLEPVLARQRGEAAVITIQGALILSQGLDDVTPFQRAIERLPEQLCRDL
jgi:TetR/AcrR family transcriptional regulator, lmrAB and yxaGH operons repressor